MYSFFDFRRLFGIAGGLLFAACAPQLDTTRAERPSLTFGGKLYADLCQRIAQEENPADVGGDETRQTCFFGSPAPRSGMPRLQALHDNRTRLVSALDTAVTDGMIDDFSQLLIDALPTYDDGTIQAFTSVLGELLKELADDSPLHKAFERLGSRKGYRPHDLRSLVRPGLQYPRLDALMTSASAAAGRDGDARPQFEQSLKALQDKLATTQANEGDEENTLTLARDLLFRSAPEFADGAPHFTTLRDARGVAELGDDATLDHPLSDTDGDGLADIDSSGRYQGLGGQPLSLPAPFFVAREQWVQRDEFGRALASSGALLYRYIDVPSTLLGAVLRESKELVKEDPATALDLILPAQRLLGRAEPQVTTLGSGESFIFDGYAVEDSPLIDLAHVGGELVSKPATYWTLRLGEDLVANNETDIARTLLLLDQISDWLDLDEVSQAGLVENNNFAADFYELTTEIASVPGLLEDLINAMRDPAIRPLGPFFASFIRHRDEYFYDPDDFNGPAIGSLVTPVNRQLPDTGSNRSIFQRFLHLVHDTAGAKLCNKEGAILDLGIISYPFSGSYAECELLEVDDMSVFYMQSIIGEAELTFKDPLIDFASDFDFLLELMSGIDGFTRSPTPAAVNRLIFTPRNSFLQNLVAPPLTADGGSIEERHPGTIFAWEAPGFFEALAPVVQAFANHGREDLFAKVMSVLHMHWASPQNDTTQGHSPNGFSYSQKSNIVSFEPLIARVLDEGEAMSVTGDLAETVYWTHLDETVWGDEILVDMTRQLFLPEWNPNLSFVDGRTSTFKGDGVTVVNALSPIWLVDEAIEKTSDIWAAHPEDEAVLNHASERLADRFLKVIDQGDGPRLENRRGRAALLLVLPFLYERISHHAWLGDLETWGQDFDVDLKSTLQEPSLQTGLRTASSMVNDPDVRWELDALLTYLLSDELHQAFPSLVVAAADLLQYLHDDTNLVPFANALAPAFAPDDGLLVRALDLSERFDAIDYNRVVPLLLSRLALPVESASNEMVLEVLIDVAHQVNRFDPQRTGHLTADDYRHLIENTGSFIGDDERGLQRLLDLIDNR